MQGDVSDEGRLPRGAQHRQEMVESEEQESGGNKEKLVTVTAVSSQIGFVPFTILRMLIHQDPKEFLRDRAPRPATPSPDRRQERRSASPRRRR